jgi:hypothetical protein
VSLSYQQIHAYYWSLRNQEQDLNLINNFYLCVTQVKFNESVRKYEWIINEFIVIKNTYKRDLSDIVYK